jgi:hypothetical protein
MKLAALLVMTIALLLFISFSPLFLSIYRFVFSIVLLLIGCSIASAMMAHQYRRALPAPYVTQPMKVITQDDLATLEQTVSLDTDQFLQVVRRLR